MKQGSRNTLLVLVAALPALVATSCNVNRTQGVQPIDFGEGMAFATPEDAGSALVSALRDNDIPRVETVLGPGSGILLSSGDPVEDRWQVDTFLVAYEAAHNWNTWNVGVSILEVGTRDWPFPIPLVHGKAGWRFDSNEGAEEILNRRIGRNELDAIQSCLAFVDAERDYYRRNPRNQSRPEYARFLVSSKGQRDGLYWPTTSSEPSSPLGALFARAESEGYSPEQGVARPYHGYLYRILHGQGPDAPGGARDYVEAGAMTGGFALIATPAAYRSSGVMTFVVNQTGLVYQKDLGPNTRRLADDIQTFNPDDSWSLVSDDDLRLQQR
ncbi:MAG: DUF2950 domain-containing protein [Planctomycetota bacterium]|nr:DUF2950 domain-containing protein [Planctomycetota bacterium]